MMNLSLFKIAPKLELLLQPHGLLVLGEFSPQSDEGPFTAGLEDQAGQIVLVGNAGSAMWDSFQESPEYEDGRADPLDRWSRRIGESVAAEVGCEVLFPFDGPPYPPFLQWAARSGQVFTSPIFLSIHRQYGLWHAYRFALVLHNQPDELNTGGDMTSPCMECDGQPCLHSCPVDAFSPAIYRVEECVNYLRQDARSTCRLRGCAARHACPLAEEFHYIQDHAIFHMNAFIKSRISSKNN